MRNFAFHPRKSCIAGAAALALLNGCSGGAPGTVAQSGNKASGSAPAAMAAVPKGPSNGPRSVFTVSPALRDPFFPGSKARAAATTTTSTAAAPMDIPALLQAGFDGVLVAGDSRIALINNIMLEKGRTVTIPLNAAGQRREVTVQVRDVLPNAVIVELQGQGQGQRQPITIRMRQR